MRACRSTSGSKTPSPFVSRYTCWNGGAIVKESPFPSQSSALRAGSSSSHDRLPRFPMIVENRSSFTPLVLDDPKLDDRLHDDVGQQSGRTAVGDAHGRRPRVPTPAKANTAASDERDHTEARVA